MIDVINFGSEFCVVSSEHEQEDIRSQPSTEESQESVSDEESTACVTAEPEPTGFLTSLMSWMKK